VEDVSVAPQVLLKQTAKTPTEQPKNPQNVLGDPSIIYLIRQKK
jgi:hypothetical protein